MVGVLLPKTDVLFKLNGFLVDFGFLGLESHGNFSEEVEFGDFTKKLADLTEIYITSSW